MVDTSDRYCLTTHRRTCTGDSSKRWGCRFERSGDTDTNRQSHSRQTDSGSHLKNPSLYEWSPTPDRSCKEGYLMAGTNQKRTTNTQLGACVPSRSSTEAYRTTTKSGRLPIVEPYSLDATVADEIPVLRSVIVNGIGDRIGCPTTPMSQSIENQYRFGLASCRPRSLLR